MKDLIMKTHCWITYIIAGHLEMKIIIAHRTFCLCHTHCIIFVDCTDNSYWHIMQWLTETSPVFMLHCYISHLNLHNMNKLNVIKFKLQHIQTQRNNLYILQLNSLRLLMNFSCVWKYLFWHIHFSVNIWS